MFFHSAIIDSLIYKLFLKVQKTKTMFTQLLILYFKKTTLHNTQKRIKKEAIIKKHNFLELISKEINENSLFRFKTLSRKYI